MTYYKRLSMKYASWWVPKLVVVIVVVVTAATVIISTLVTPEDPTIQLISIVFVFYLA